ncbi:MAG TPA: DUF5715 family protein [Candidatus Angelobacter sp.]|nr:DUF5715 family protein [Candidatus Angelobacter sp.]
MHATKKLFILSVITLMALFTATAASAATRSYTRHRGHTRRIKWNPVLRGSHESMLRQNEEIDRLQLPRINDQAQLEELVRNQELIPIHETAALRVSPAIEPDKRYCRPWTNYFLQDMSDAYYHEFHVPLQVNSAVRTLDQQQKLRRHNRNAAPEVGDIASSHLAGITVDLAKRGISRAQHKWIEDYLKDLRDQGLVEAAEERRQACFHVMVSDRYTEFREKRQIADKLEGE